MRRRRRSRCSRICGRCSRLPEARWNVCREDHDLPGRHGGFRRGERRVRAAFSPRSAPARSTVAVKALPKGASVEIDAVALVDRGDAVEPRPIGAREWVVVAPGGNLEDLKSFRRVPPPSEVGLIPTHSRQFHRTLVLLCVLIAVGARRRERGGAGSPVPLGTPKPAAACGAQRGVPGLGAAHGPKVEEGGGPVRRAQGGILVTRGYSTSRERHARSRRGKPTRCARRRSDDPSLVEPEEETRASARDHPDTRRDLIFLDDPRRVLRSADAYVDANLGDFWREELKEGRRLFASADPEERTMEIGVRF